MHVAGYMRIGGGVDGNPLYDFDTSWPLGAYETGGWV